MQVILRQMRIAESSAIWTEEDQWSFNCWLRIEYSAQENS